MGWDPGGSVAACAGSRLTVAQAPGFNGGG